MSEYTIPVVKYNDVDTVGFLVDLMNQITKVVPDISFKPRQMNKWNIDTKQYTDGVCESMNIYHAEDINNHIGIIEISNYYRKSDKPKYGILNVNIDDGRQTYGGEGQYKYSIHPKNIVRIAKKTLKPFTFDQIAERHRREFKNAVDNLGNTMRWNLRSCIGDNYQSMIDDLENLYHMGYRPTNNKFKQMMQYVIDNKQAIDKYNGYDPTHYFVVVKENRVQYKLMNGAQTEPFTLQSKDELPDDIKGKLFVLDITEKQDFIEDVGLKQNDGAYWIIA